MPRFLRAIEPEIALAGAAPWARGVQAASVFFGGGTRRSSPPSSWPASSTRSGPAFPLEAGAEVTVECNPESVSRDRLAGYRAAGVNRISLGVQSLEDRVLPTLDRLHTAADARRAFDDARAAGFDNVSVDLIYGLPGTDGAGWERTVAGVLAWAPDHLSAYALSLDEGSLWSAAGVGGLPARGRGGGAVSDPHPTRPRRRLRALRDLQLRAPRPPVRAQPALLAGGGVPRVRPRGLRLPRRGALRQREAARPLLRHAGGRTAAGGDARALTARQRLAERLFLGLRTADGVPAAWLDERVDLEPARLAPPCSGWRERGLLETRDGRARLTEDGFLSPTPSSSTCFSVE